MRRALAGLLGGLALLGAGPVAAQGLPTDASTEALWTIRPPGARNDWVNTILPLSDGRFLAAGFLGRDDEAEGEDWTGWVLSFDGEGRIDWLREYGKGSGTDALWGLAPAPGGGFVAVGFTDRLGSGGLDAWIARLGPDGELLGETAIGGAGYDRLTDVTPAPGGFIAVGFQTGDGRDLLIVGLDPDGRERWRKVYGGPGAQSALYVEPAGDGGFIVAGGDDAAGDGDVLVLKVDAAGEVLWRRLIGERGGLDVPHNLAVLPDGRIRMSGYTASWGAQGEHDMLALTLSPDGEVLVRDVFGGAGDDRVMVSGLDGQGRDWLAGYTRSTGSGDWDVFVTTLDPQGRFEGGVAILGASPADNGTLALPLPGGDLLVGAYTRSLGEGDEDAVVMRLRSPRWPAPHPAFQRR